MTGDILPNFSDQPGGDRFIEQAAADDTYAPGDAEAAATESGAIEGEFDADTADRDDKALELRRPTADEESGYIDYDLEPLWIPLRGVAHNDLDHIYLSEHSEPTVEDLDRFFADHPEAVGRFVHCPKINVDMTDDWGMFGYEPGFIFVAALRQKGANTLASAGIFQHLAENPGLPLSTGDMMPIVSHFDFWPHGWGNDKYYDQIITGSRTPTTFRYIIEKFLDGRLPTPEEIKATAVLAREATRRAISEQSEQE